MKKIYTLHLEALKEKCYIAFIIFVLDAIGKFEIIEQLFPQFVANLRAAYDHMNGIYLKYDAEFCTQKVQDADAARNTAFRKFRDSVKWFITFPETEAKTQAAEIILRIIELYGGTRIPNQGITAKTTSIVNLVEDLEDKYPTEVETLGVGGLVEALKAAQAAFAEVYMQRAECESEQAKGAMADARRKTSEAYRDFVTIVNIAANSDHEGQLTEFINLMNVEVGRNRSYTGQGQVNSTAGSETETDTVRMRTARFELFGGRIETITAEVGSALTAPANTEGYRWDPEVPAVMPAKNTTYYEILTGEITPTKYTLTFVHGGKTFATYELEAGTTITAPDAPEDYHWVDVPAKMPAENLTIYSEEDTGFRPPILS